MRAALEMAREAFDDGEVPVGAVVVRNGEIISRGRNRREKTKNPPLRNIIVKKTNAARILHTFTAFSESCCFISITPSINL